MVTQTVCGDGTSSIQLSANLSTAAGVVWSGGAGSFSPNRQTSNAFYTPAASEIGLIPLFINATSTGSNCISSTGTTNIAIQSKPTILAGGPYTICSNNLIVALSATGTGFTGGATWSIVTGNGSISSANVSAASANYNATNVDATLGGVNLLVTSVGNGVCSAVSANTGITFINPPTISAGQDRVVCINNPTLTLTGSFGGTSPEGVQWALGSAGTGTFTGITTTTSAIFTATNTTSPIKIYLTSTGLNLCNAVKDSMLLSFSAAPTISGISDNMVCGDVSGVVLNANVTIASGLVWSSNGTGTFIPDRNSIKPTYVPSAAEKSGAIITFTATTSGNGNCNAVQATSTLTV
ncbi:MAG: hypothetical protein K2Q22_10800, partial [Cytophagales bacterium]|nr:hypothetical protein [Cytophagales bacterium]